MARRRRSRPRVPTGRGKAWGNALGGYKSQRRINGEFASGKGPSLKRQTAKSRRAEGYRKKLANDRRARNRRNTRNGAIGAVVVGAALGGAVYAHQTNQTKKRGPDRVVIKSFLPPARRRHGPRRHTIPGQVAPRGKPRHTGSYRGREIKWTDPMNKSKKFGTLRRGKISNGSPEIWTKGIKVPGSGGRRASTVIGVSSKNVQMGVIKSSSVSQALSGSKAKKVPLRSRSAAAKRAREQRSIDRMMGY